MPIHHATLDDLRLALQGVVVGGPLTVPGSADVVVVDLDAADPAAPAPSLHAAVPAVVVGLTALDAGRPHPAAAACDVLVAPGDPSLEAVVATVAANPAAAGALVSLLRGSEDRSLHDGLLAESAVYSALQAGPEFARWRVGRPRRRGTGGGDPVQAVRDGDRLDVTLSRPDRRNALDTAMRDALVEVFTLVALDDTIAEVHLRGSGEAFCSGGDLDEFGTFPDPATAHLVRLRQSVGRGVAAVADRVTAHLHGACVGSGIELPAFAGTVVAHPSTFVGLPEVSLGLVPGAGGTVSLPRRIGRHRTARLALTGERIGAEVALAWGLVDAVEA